MAEEIKLIPITTTAGLQKFFQVSGLPEVKLKLTHIGFGDSGYTPDKNQTSLKKEIIRIPISSGKVFPSDGYMDLSALIPEDVPEFWIREIGWYLEDGTLAFVWSHPEVPIAWKNKNLKLLAGISVRITDVPLDKIEIVESNPDLKLLYTEEFMQISQILTNHETAIVAVKDKADEAIATANAIKEELQNVQVPRITVLEEKTNKIEQQLQNFNPDFTVSKRRFADNSPTLKVGDSIVINFNGSEAKISSTLGIGIYELAIYLDTPRADAGKPVIEIESPAGTFSCEPIGNNYNHFNAHAAIVARLFCGEEFLTLQGFTVYDSDPGKVSSNYTSFLLHKEVDGTTVKSIVFKLLKSDKSAHSISGKLSISITRLI